MATNYKYWNLERTTDTECIISIREKDFEEEKEKIKKELEDVEQREKNAKEEMEKADETEILKKRGVYAVVSSEYKKICSRISKLEEQEKISRLNNGMEIRVQRLKDLYSREECVAIILVMNSVEDVKICSAISKVRDDVRKLENYGVYLTPPYYEELVKVVQDVYYEIIPLEREFIENDVPKYALVAFVRMCKESIIQNEEDQEKENFLDAKKECYNVPVAIFKSWYTDSAFRRFSITSLKEALYIHDYVRVNKGRNDYTLAKVGKMISFYKKALDNLAEEDKKR